MHRYNANWMVCKFAGPPKLTLSAKTNVNNQANKKKRTRENGSVQRCSAAQKVELEWEWSLSGCAAETRKAEGRGIEMGVGWEGRHQRKGDGKLRTKVDEDHAAFGCEGVEFFLGFDGHDCCCDRHGWWREWGLRVSRPRNVCCKRMEGGCAPIVAQLNSVGTVWWWWDSARKRTLWKA